MDTGIGAPSYQPTTLQTTSHWAPPTAPAHYNHYTTYSPPYNAPVSQPSGHYYPPKTYTYHYPGHPTPANPQLNYGPSYLDQPGSKFHEDLKRTQIEGKILVENPTINHKNYAIMTCAPDVNKLSLNYETEK